MASVEKLAAIDIGSNGIRLLIGEVDDHGDIHAIKRLREPVRLGKDAFAQGVISKKTAAQAIQSFEKFAKLMRRHDVDRVRAVATSALRESRNKDEFVALVRKKTGIKIEIISGLQEAKLIHSAVSHRVTLENRNSVLIDIGGGSVEITISVDGKLRAMKSFKLGTVRLLQVLIERNLQEKSLRYLLQRSMGDLNEFVARNTKGEPIDFCIGTGGNFETLGKLRVALLNRSSVSSMTVFELGQIMDHLLAMSVKERVQFLRLRPDRADVIVPAGLVVHTIMRKIPCEMLVIPHVGLREGILSHLAEND